MAQDAFDLMAESNLEGVIGVCLPSSRADRLRESDGGESGRASEELGNAQAARQRSIKRLIALGVILEGPKIGISRSYRLNPEFGWKGSARNP